MRFMVGSWPVIEADKGYLLSGRMVDDGPVFERFTITVNSLLFLPRRIVLSSLLRCFLVGVVNHTFT